MWKVTGKKHNEYILVASDLHENSNDNSNSLPLGWVGNFNYIDTWSLSWMLGVLNNVTIT